MDYMAGQALAGILADPEVGGSCEQIAMDAAKGDSSGWAEFIVKACIDRHTLQTRIAELDTKCLDLIADVDRLEFFAEERNEQIAKFEAQLDAMRAAAPDVCKMVVAEKAEEEIAGVTDR